MRNTMLALTALLLVPLAVTQANPLFSPASSGVSAPETSRPNINWLFLAPCGNGTPCAASPAPQLPNPEATLRTLKAGWEKPARTFKPHTRWWWPGNALTKTDITWQLEQMAAQGIGGVEIMSAWKMYERGNVEYLTPEFLALVKHAVAEAKRAGHRSGHHVQSRLELRGLVGAKGRSK